MNTFVGTYLPTFCILFILNTEFIYYSRNDDKIFQAYQKT